MRAFIISISIFIVAALTGPNADARDSRIQAFFGTYAGSAISRNRDSEYFGVTLRDLDFTVEAHGDSGFRVSWTTVTRERGTPRNPEERERSATMTFEPVAGRTRVYRAVGNQDPLSTDGYYAWARIQEQTLNIHIMTIDDNGVYQVATYSRTLTAGGMDIEFTRVRDGDKVRSVSGRALRER